MKKKVVKKKAKVVLNPVIQTDYLDSVYGRTFYIKLPQAVKFLKQLRKKVNFDAIAFTGTSGAGFAFPLSYLLRVPLICVRKKTSSHCHLAIEGTLDSKRYLIVDDFIASGATIRKIRKTIRNNRDTKKAVPVGIFLYDSGRTAKFDKLTVWTLP